MDWLINVASKTLTTLVARRIWRTRFVIATLTKPAIPNRLFLPNTPLGFIVKQDFFSKPIARVHLPKAVFRLVTGLMDTSLDYYKPFKIATKTQLRKSARLRGKQRLSLQTAQSRVCTLPTFMFFPSARSWVWASPVFVDSGLSSFLVDHTVF